MITHTILKYKHQEQTTATMAPSSNIIALPNQNTQGETFGSNHGHLFGKLPYVAFFNFTSARFKKGDFVVQKDATFPYAANAIWKVMDISECHWICKDNHFGGKPKPLVCKDKQGIPNYFNPNDVIVVSELDEELKF